MSVDLQKTKLWFSVRVVFWVSRNVGTMEAINWNSSTHKYFGFYFTTKLSLTFAVDNYATKSKIRTTQLVQCL